MTDIDPDATVAIPVIDIDAKEPINWELAAEAIDPYIVDPGQYAHDPEWAEFMRQQLGRCLWYLIERCDASASDLKAVARRAAVILNAEGDAPEMERQLGIRLAVQFEGQEVKCRSCRTRYVALPELPYYDATTRANGLCDKCVLTETRTDAAVPILTGSVVPKSTAVAKTTARKRGTGNG